MNQERNKVSAENVSNRSCSGATCSQEARSSRKTQLSKGGRKSTPSDVMVLDPDTTLGWNQKVTISNKN